MSARTQTAIILDHLRRGGTLTAVEALEAFGCFRLASRIAELREAGWPVVTETITTRGGARIARYRLAVPAVAEQGSLWR